MVNKTTGWFSFHSEWFVDGLEVDLASVDHYTIIADWVTQVSNDGMPIHLSIINVSSNISVAKVSTYVLCYKYFMRGIS